MKIHPMIWTIDDLVHWLLNELNSPGIGDAYISLRPRDAYMRQQTKPPLVQIMAYHMFGAKPLCEPMLIYCQLDPWESTSVKF